MLIQKSHSTWMWNGSLQGSIYGVFWISLQGAYNLNLTENQQFAAHLLSGLR